MSLEGEAVSLHDVVTALRSGTVGSRSFSRVIAVVTGLVHAASETALSFLPAANHEANLDPKFAGGSGLDGYFTTVPGVRGFYHSPTTSNADIIALDEVNKEIHSSVEFPQIVAFALPPTPADATTRQITTPVLVMIGGDDLFFCTPDTIDCSRTKNVRAYEARYWHTSGANRRVGSRESVPLGAAAGASEDGQFQLLAGEDGAGRGQGVEPDQEVLGDGVDVA